MERHTLEHSTVVMSVHNAADCQYPERCVIHNMTDHPMREFRQTWRSDWGGFMERTCPHGIGHPDPDSVFYQTAHLDKDFKSVIVHGCDGCCAGSYNEWTLKRAEIEEAIRVVREQGYTVLPAIEPWQF